MLWAEATSVLKLLNLKHENHKRPGRLSCLVALFYSWWSWDLDTQLTRMILSFLLRHLCSRWLNPLKGLPTKPSDISLVGYFFHDALALGNVGRADQIQLMPLSGKIIFKLVINTMHEGREGLWGYNKTLAWGWRMASLRAGGLDGDCKEEEELVPGTGGECVSRAEGPACTSKQKQEFEVLKTGPCRSRGHEARLWDAPESSDWILNTVKNLETF